MYESTRKKVFLYGFTALDFSFKGWLSVIQFVDLPLRIHQWFFFLILKNYEFFGIEKEY